MCLCAQVSTSYLVTSGSLDATGVVNSLGTANTYNQAHIAAESITVVRVVCICVRTWLVVCDVAMCSPCLVQQLATQNDAALWQQKCPCKTWGVGSAVTILRHENCSCVSNFDTYIFLRPDGESALCPRLCHLSSFNRRSFLLCVHCCCFGLCTGQDVEMSEPQSDPASIPTAAEVFVATSQAEACAALPTVNTQQLWGGSWYAGCQAVSPVNALLNEVTFEVDGRFLALLVSCADLAGVLRPPPWSSPPRTEAYFTHHSSSTTPTYLV